MELTQMPHTEAPTTSCGWPSLAGLASTSVFVKLLKRRDLSF